MKPRPDLVPQSGGEAIKVYQLTDEPVPACHIYMEAQIFFPDSRRFVLHRSAHPHGSDPDDPAHQYVLCDLATGGELTPLTNEVGVTAPAVSPDGRFFYYFVDNTEPGAGTLTLKRRDMESDDREVIHVLDGPIGDTSYRISQPYPLSTISADGNHIALSGFLGDGLSADAPWGLLVYDVRDPDPHLALSGNNWCNVHPQYCRSEDQAYRYDIMVQENHGCAYDERGRVLTLVSGDGADIHVIRDDGSNRRTLPWGRDGHEYCQGHQCWRGQSNIAITSTITGNQPRAELIEGRPVAWDGHPGKAAGGWRNVLTRDMDAPDFHHFATDRAGTRLITDCGPNNRDGSVILFELPTEPDGTLERGQTVALPRSSWEKASHIHPFLSPDGQYGFFNSDEGGVLQAYMVTGWDV